MYVRQDIGKCSLDLRRIIPEPFIRVFTAEVYRISGKECAREKAQLHTDGLPIILEVCHNILASV
jgi:hypothetical protein